MFVFWPTLGAHEHANSTELKQNGGAPEWTQEVTLGPCANSMLKRPDFIDRIYFEIHLQKATYPGTWLRVCCFPFPPHPGRLIVLFTWSKDMSLIFQQTQSTTHQGTFKLQAPRALPHSLQIPGYSQILPQPGESHDVPLILLHQTGGGWDMGVSFFEGTLFGLA